MPLSGKKVVKILLNKGWRIRSQRGSHIKLVKDKTLVHIPVHGNRDLPIGLLKAIEKQTGEKLR